jgi:hypothetical protein
MEHTIDSFIKELQSISEDKRKLPLVIQCPNGETTSPSIKMLFNEKEHFLFGDKPIAMIVSWRD